MCGETRNLNFLWDLAKKNLVFLWNTLYKCFMITNGIFWANFLTKSETLKKGKSPVRFYKHWPLGREITISFFFYIPNEFHVPPPSSFDIPLPPDIPSHHCFARFILLPSSSSSQFPPWQPVYWNQWALSCLHPDAATIFFLMSTEEWYHYDHNYFEGKVQDEAI